MLPLDGSTVKLKGLPFKATIEDVIQFFNGFTLESGQVYMKRHPDGRPNGEAFIVFENPGESRRATQKDRATFGEKFGDRYVRVYPTVEADMIDVQSCVLQQATSQGSGGHINGGSSDSVVKIKSLPFDATQLDIIQFFDTFKLKPNGVQLVVRSDNKPTGEAFVDFESPEEAARSIRDKDHKVFSERFGDRYVRLIQVSRKEMQATLALRFGGEGIHKMKGIPFKATAADVRKFFSGYKIKPDGISFIMHADGRPTGMAFIEFETPHEAVRAMEKDRAKFGPEYGDRFCMLQLVGRHDMDKVTLQKESDIVHVQPKLIGLNNLNSMNNFNALQAAVIANATQAALNNPTALLMASANPWLHLGLVNSANSGIPGVPLPMSSSGQQLSSNMASSMLDASMHHQYLSHLADCSGSSPSGNLSNGFNSAALNGLSFLSAQPNQGSGSLQDLSQTWIPQMDPSVNAHPLLFYKNGQGQDWTRADPRFAQLSNML